MALMHCFMGKHWLANDIAHGKDIAHISAHLI
jgi:hypothetical protein